MSRTRHPLPSTLSIRGTVLKESDDLDILEVTFDSKMSFDETAASQRVGMFRKS